MKKIITDTNVLMDDHRILNKLSEKYDQIQIPLTVLKELDKHKFNPDLSYSARKAIHAILDFKEKYKDKIKFIVNDFEISDNDLKIIKSAEVEGADIATKDISMSLIANSKGIETILYDVIVNNLFKPYIKLKIEEISSFLNFEQSYIEEKYEDIFERINIISNENKLRKNGWMFIFLYDNDTIPEVIYAHNPIRKEIIRIDNNPLYREIEIESGMKVKALDEYQLCAFYAFKEAPNILLTGKWGTGKTLLSTAYSIEKSKRKIFISRPPIGINKKYDIGYLPGPQPLDCKILTPNGWKTMGEINTGDYVININGKKSKVLKTFDKGIKPVYKIETTNGGLTKACGDHVWSVKNNNELKHNKDYKLRSTLEIKETLYNKNKGCKYNYSLPKNPIVEFDYVDNLPIPPYTMGALLGDGSFSNSISISNMDIDLIERIERELSQFDLYLNKHDISYTISGNYKNNKPAKPVKLTNLITKEEKIYDTINEASINLKINKTTLNSRCNKKLIIDNILYEFLPKKQRWTNYLKNIIYDLKLEGTKADTKFIPNIYKYTSIENRISILQGLMDTDGTIKKKYGSMSYTTISKQLADDVVEICRSLGINAFKYTRNRIGEKHIFNDRTIKTNSISYEVNIPKSNEIELFYIKRKKDLIQKNNNKLNNVKIKNIEYIGEEKVKCILLDDDDHLYITDDFIITHNTADEKMFSWFAGILSSIYYLYSNTRNQKMKDVEYDYVKDKVFPSKFETIPLNAIQGMSLLNDDILLVDEIQLIDIDYLSMILSRSGENSKTILLGDVKQTYGVVKPSESGLLKLLRLLPHENLAYVDLQIPYRSSLLELADKLQDSIIM